MHFHLLLLCLYFHFSISKLNPHTSNERQVNYPVRSSALGDSRKQEENAGHWNPRNYYSTDTTTQSERPRLKARTGGDTPAIDALEKQWAKKIRLATSKWENSVNGKALRALFLKKILPSPYVSVTQCVAMLHGSPFAMMWEQLAILESLTGIISTYPPNRWMIVSFSSNNFIPDQKHPFERSKVRIAFNKNLQDDEVAVLRRRGYTVSWGDSWETMRNEYVTPTTFSFVGTWSPKDVYEILGPDGVTPSVYFGPSPKYLISDLMKRPSYVPLHLDLLAHY
jgi:hypothetical protein